MNRLSGYANNAGGSGTYKYDFTGIRTQKVSGSATTNYYSDESGRVLAETNASGTVTAQNIWGAKPLARIIGGKWYYYLYNQHGDVVRMVDDTGALVNSYAYDEWGNIIQKSETIANPIRYAGEYQDDESGYYYLRARYYDPVYSRFVSRDTNEGKITNPLSLNLYAYCEENPVMGIDPTGHVPWTSLSDFGSDGAGRDILQHYLYGGGTPLNITNDKGWTEYLENDKMLTAKVSNLVIGYTSQVKNGDSKYFDITTSMEIENGEQMIGYQYLHGTNSDVGGFQMQGTITKDKKGNATVAFTYQWNDRIDPNFMYSSDSVKAKFAKSIPFANPQDYTIRIRWSDISTINAHGDYKSGWLFAFGAKVSQLANSAIHKVRQ